MSSSSDSDPSSSSEIFKQLDPQNTGSIELNFNQVRVKHANSDSAAAGKPVQVLTCFLCVCLQWINFSMI